MATLNFPDEPDTGDIYSDSNSGFSYEWNGTVWISTDPSTASNIKEIDDISGDFDGSETDFTLKVAAVNIEPVNAQQLIVSVGGVMQNAGDDFTVSGSTLTFTTAPTAGLGFFGTYLGTALSLNTVADGTVSPSSLTTTSNYLMGGLTVDQSAGIITAYQFKGDGSGLTGVASTDNIKTSTDAYFGANVSIGGSLTVQGTETIINVEELNVQDKTIGIGSTSTPTATTQDGAGAIIYGQTHIDILYDVDKAALGISTGVNVSGFVTATRAQVGTGVTITNTGIDAGIGAGIITAKTYYGDATNMTGAGSTFQALSFDPFQGKTLGASELSDAKIALTFNHGIEAGNAAKEVTLRTSSASGTIVQSFGVGSSITYSAGQAILDPSATLSMETTYYVVVPEGAFKKIGTASSCPVLNTYSFLSADFYRRWYSLGWNTNGQLGQNDRTTSSSPIQVGSKTNYKMASIHKQYSWTNFTIRTDNTLWFTGYGGDGNNGLNVATLTRSSPTQVPGITWDRVAVGEAQTLARKTDGTIWTWGYGDDGSLGLNEGNTRRSSPTQIGTDTTWSDQIFAGGKFCAVVKTDGTLWTWGQGQSSGRLGHNEASTSYSSPKQVGTDTTWNKLPLSNAGAGAYMLATKTNGTLWAWGYQNNSGILGQNQATESRSSPTQIGTGTDWAGVSCSQNTSEAHAIATKTDGTLWAWGWNNGGLGQNNETDYSSPVQIPGTTWEYEKYADEGYIAGGVSTAALKQDGTMWVWGSNVYGQLGLNNKTSYSSPKQMGGLATWGSVSMGGQPGNKVATVFFSKQEE